MNFINDITMIVDRVREFETTLKKYNDVKEDMVIITLIIVMLYFGKET